MLAKVESYFLDSLRHLSSAHQKQMRAVLYLLLFGILMVPASFFASMYTLNWHNYERYLINHGLAGLLVGGGLYLLRRGQAGLATAILALGAFVVTIGRLATLEFQNSHDFQSKLTGIALFIPISALIGLRKTFFPANLMTAACGGALVMTTQYLDDAVRLNVLSSAMLQYIIITVITYLIIQIMYSSLDESHRQTQEQLELNQRLNSLLDSIRRTAETLASSSASSADAAAAFLNSARDQAATVDEMEAAMTQMSAGIENISESATRQNKSMHALIQKMAAFSSSVDGTKLAVNEALDVSKGIAGLAQQSEEAMNRLSGSIKAVSTSSAEMNDIIQIINNISGQINLLALNASIEAARAGAAGKGFAVVANEVSNLADKTSASADEISRLIIQNEQEINASSQAAENTVETLTQIINGVNSIHRQMGGVNAQIEVQLKDNAEINAKAEEVKALSEDISTATGEHQIAGREVLTGLEQVSRLTTENQAGGQNLERNAADIAKLASSLRDEVQA